VGIEPT